MADPQKDEHIEELLSKLQGIFGKLSHSEEEEAKQAVEVPASAPKEPEPKITPEPTPKAPPPTPMSETPIAINLYSEPTPNEEPPAPTPAPPKSAADPFVQSAPAPAPASTLSPQSTYETIVPTEDPERVIVPTAVYFLPGKENEAKSLAMKLETMTPKFTKVAFRLRVIVFLPYDPKSDWKESLLAKAAEAHFQTVFVAVDRLMDDAKKKAIVADLEANNIYLQEVPIASIEKKAFYTDILLGLVFFFDSRKPATPPEGS